MDLSNLLDFTGLVLLSNNPNGGIFQHSVAVVIQHNKDTETMGLCINFPLRLMLNDFDEDAWSAFDNVPVFRGGPSQPKRILVTSMTWDANRQMLRWQLGLDQQQALQLMAQHPKSGFKAYCGHISWQPGELAHELQQNLWLPVPMPSKKIFKIANHKLWHTLMLQFYPEYLKELPDFPENPTLN